MANESATRYYYNTNWQVLCEGNSSGTILRWYVYGNYIDEPLMMAVGTNKYYYVQDHLYSTAALVNSAGTVVERYEYNVFKQMELPKWVKMVMNVHVDLRIQPKGVNNLN